MAMHYEEGFYLCEVKDQAFTKSSTEKPMIVLTVHPVERLRSFGTADEYAEELVGQGYDRRINLVINPENEQQNAFTMRKLRVNGFTGRSFAELNLVGRTIKCRCTPQEYKEELRENWDLAIPSKTVEHDPALSHVMDTMMEKYLQSETLMREAEPDPEPEWADDIEPQVPDDGIPF